MAGRTTTAPIDECVNVIAIRPVRCVKHRAKPNADTRIVPRNAKSPVHHALKIAHGYAHTVDAFRCLVPSPAVFFRVLKGVEKGLAAAICAPKDIKGIMVSYVLYSTYGDVDLDEDPVIVPLCGYLIALSSMDGHIGMSDYYVMSPSSSIEALKPLPEAFSMENVKKCPMCQGPLQDVNRYNRIVRQGLIKEATKRLFLAPINSMSHTSNAYARKKSGVDGLPCLVRMESIR
ncbi:hypothetical protein MMC28_008796 [Mycoblastus sanguinarius]|nr:hypothetical protein [Mycoblastus sanguinarius]